ncbi:hypothetical protein P152DRAFT_250201 [Eremomyces bilateralis CBS 781.70]|uniref:Uncharacterized protein n=1 Tax=Eremomyces bilateralis CBS 781.70 TaxID=1392243 RepID=A0A6G1GAY5_9PEZI|nr:uncharacterized protein P152DRAFT_250201 [Eremomyces bilateralis CBS 781.70]KAF1815248.1 hypothetical protein P152DRAFT_250201 [Eremomyces bilateralis CBS 781.70]
MVSTENDCDSHCPFTTVPSRGILNLSIVPETFILAALCIRFAIRLLSWIQSQRHPPGLALSICSAIYCPP